MKREILFIAQRVDNKEWVKGYYIKSSKVYHLGESDIIVCGDSYNGYCGREFYDVIPETVCQFTGLTDKNGTKIFECDIVKWIDSDGNNRIDKVWYHNGGFVLCNIEHHIGDYIHNYLEVIGNIYDNPELLK